MTTTSSSSYQNGTQGQQQQHSSHSQHAAAHQGLSPFVCACFTLNYIIGTGFLTLPWAFAKAGWLFSSLTLCLACIVANIASDYILSSCARADALLIVLEDSTITTSSSSTSSSATISSKTRDTRDAGSTATDNIEVQEKESLIKLHHPYNNCRTQGSYQSIDNSDADNNNITASTIIKREKFLELELAVEWNKSENADALHPNMSPEDYIQHVKDHGKLLVGERKFELTELVCSSNI